MRKVLDNIRVGRSRSCVDNVATYVGQAGLASPLRCRAPHYPRGAANGLFSSAFTPWAHLLNVLYGNHLRAISQSRITYSEDILCTKPYPPVRIRPEIP